MESQIMMCDLETAKNIITLALENGQYLQGFQMRENPMLSTSYVLIWQSTKILE